MKVHIFVRYNLYTIYYNILILRVHSYWLIIKFNVQIYVMFFVFLHDS